MRKLEKIGFSLLEEFAHAVSDTINEALHSTDTSQPRSTAAAGPASRKRIPVRTGRHARFRPAGFGKTTVIREWIIDKDLGKPSATLAESKPCASGVLVCQPCVGKQEACGTCMGVALAEHAGIITAAINNRAKRFLRMVHSLCSCFVLAV